MTTLREAAQQALEALAIGQDAAHEVAQTYHEAMAGYRPARHIAVDDDVRKIEDAITALRAALAETKPCNKSCAPGYCYCECPHGVTDGGCKECYEAKATVPSDCSDSHQPVAWYHVPYPGNGIRPMVSLSQQHEPSMYGAVVPLYLAPPQRKPLTEEEIQQCFMDAGITIKGQQWTRVVRNVERAHGVGAGA